jgi:hypothetical protein
MENLDFKTLRLINNFCSDLHSEPDWREVAENLDLYVDDFEVDNVRFIKDSEILTIMAEEIFSDEYTLGCFNANFIAQNSALPEEVIEACQECEAFEAIGKSLNAIMSQDDKESFCEEYASADGYGHHFNMYDFSDLELSINGNLYHVFDNH